MFLNVLCCLLVNSANSATQMVASSSDGLDGHRRAMLKGVNNNPVVQWGRYTTPISKQSSSTVSDTGGCVDWDGHRHCIPPWQHTRRDERVDNNGDHAVAAERRTDPHNAGQHEVVERCMVVPVPLLRLVCPRRACASNDASMQAQVHKYPRIHIDTDTDTLTAIDIGRVFCTQRHVQRPSPSRAYNKSLWHMH